jgi:hypothetical protein
MHKNFTLAFPAFLVFILLLLAATACSDRAKPVTTDPVFARRTAMAEENAALAKQLLLEKLHIDALTVDTLTPPLVFTKVPGQLLPVPVRNRQYPKKLEAIYQVCRDSLGRIVYLAESPFSASGDWDIVYRSYYDGRGRIFAFERTAGFFNSACIEGALYETTVKFFNAQGQVVATEQTYADDKGTPIRDKPCDFPYNFPYEVVTDVATYCRKLNLRL